MLAEEVAAGVYRVPIPVPLPLRFVNCYLLRGPDGWALVDAGMRDPAAEAAWVQVFAELDIPFTALDTILVTHYHPDHYGLAGWLQERSGARVLMGAIEFATVERIWRRDVTAAAAFNRQFFVEHGMPMPEVTAIEQLMLATMQQILPQPVVTLIDPAQPLQLGGRWWELLVLPGHADGQLALYDRADALLLIADHVLPTITPNISLWPESRPDPLSAYLATLHTLRELPVRLALPGHRLPFADFGARCDAIAAHHTERLAAMRAVARSTTAWEICSTIFPVAALSAHQTRFAMAETLAHVAWLEQQNQIVRRWQDDVAFFEAS